MKLYYSPGACSMSPHIVLREIGKKFELESVDLGTKTDRQRQGLHEDQPEGLCARSGNQAGRGADRGRGHRPIPRRQGKGHEASAQGRHGPLPGDAEMLNYIAAEVHKSMGALFAKGISEDVRKATLEKISKRLEHLDGILAKSKFLLGKSFSVADAYAFTIFSWGPHLKVDMSPYKNIAAYMERVGKRPAVQAVLKAEGLAK